MKPCILAACVVLCGSRASAAVPLTPGDILATRNQTLYEFTPLGVLVGSASVPQPTTGETGAARGNVVDANNHVDIYNGTFNPTLTTYANGSFTQTQFAGLSTVNNGSSGGAAAFGDFVYLTDQNTANPGAAPDGIVRFDINNPSSAVRFASAPPNSTLGSGFDMITIGYDGLLYGLGPVDHGVAVWDPLTLTHVRDLTLPLADYRGVAVDASGDIFVYEWNGTIYHFDANGTLIKSVQLTHPFANFAGGTLSLKPNGQLLLASPDGLIYVGDTSLNSFTSFTVTGSDTRLFASWVQPPPVPEPSSLTALVATAAACFATRRRRPRMRGRLVPDSGQAD